MTEQLVQRIPEVIVEGKRLGRHIRIDERSRAYRVTAPATLSSRLWLATNDDALDQGGYGACIGFGFAHALNTIPFGMQLQYADALDLYRISTTLDPFPGDFPSEDTGSSVLAGAQACRQLGYIRSWSNAYSLDDVLAGLQTRAGAFGCTWFSGCDDPEESAGMISPTGAVRGGHCTAIVGCNIEEGLITLRNSWGPSWGVDCYTQSGYFSLTFLEFQALLAMTGDAIFPDLP